MSNCHEVLLNWVEGRQSRHRQREFTGTHWRLCCTADSYIAIKIKKNQDKVTNSVACCFKKKESFVAESLVGKDERKLEKRRQNCCLPWQLHSGEMGASRTQASSFALVSSYRLVYCTSQTGLVIVNLLHLIKNFSFSRKFYSFLISICNYCLYISIMSAQWICFQLKSVDNCNSEHLITVFAAAETWT